MLLVRCLSALSIAIIATTTQSKGATVSWVLPRAVDSFSPGDRIVGEWNTEQPILSPSFRLCRYLNDYSEEVVERVSKEGISGNCGSAIWPLITQSAGSYSISLVAPKTEVEDKYILRMEDEFGAFYESPNFSLVPSESFATAEGDLPAIDPSQTPLGRRPTGGNATESGGKINSAIGLIPEIPRPLVDSSAPSMTNGSNPESPLDTTNTTGFATPSFASTTPNVLAAHTTVATAAYVIPLAVSFVILIIAGGLAVRQRHKVRQQRQSDAKKLSMLREVSWNKKPIGDIEHALEFHNKSPPILPAPVPVPLFMPPEVHTIGKCSFSESLPIAHHNAPPDRKSTMVSRRSSNRSILSKYSLPSIVPSPTGFFDAHDGVTHSVISSYFEPSPPVSPSQLPSMPKRLHLRDGTTIRRNSNNDNPLPHRPL